MWRTPGPSIANLRDRCQRSRRVFVGRSVVEARAGRAWFGHVRRGYAPGRCPLRLRLIPRPLAFDPSERAGGPVDQALARRAVGRVPAHSAAVTSVITGRQRYPDRPELDRLLSPLRITFSAYEPGSADLLATGRACRCRTIGEPACRVPRTRHERDFEPDWRARRSIVRREPNRGDGREQPAR